ncbi:hypothetical protein F4680DRAFT_408500 [Xylaria scruposa]|nr:hypothetical protein F4680DRAFT_408500 [Xylaria scruposa]
MKKLLWVFRDAIKCRRSLNQDAYIFNQDISLGNAEINVTGTRPFMAIGVLRSERYTYRYDLESFLYVFLWTIITNHAESPPETSKLRQWDNGDWDELATRKYSERISS